jgi:alpha-1,2-mannosyltransferase
MFGPIKRVLHARRLTVYCGLMLLVFQALMHGRVALDNWHEKGHPSGFDFQTFWAASHLTLHGTPLLAYDWKSIVQTSKLISPNTVSPGPWFYPPNFLLIVEPFARLPSGVASLIFASLTALMFILLARRTLNVPDSLVWILAFPGLWLNAAQGQNAALTGSLAFGALLALRARPVLAGVLIGLLSIKPHLGILFPVALACAGLWTTFIAAGVTVTVFTAISIGVFGVSIVPAFLHGLSEANVLLANGTLPLDQMASLFAALRLRDVPVNIAYLAQACQAVLGIASVAWVWRNNKTPEVRAAALVGSTFLISPYIYNYDCVWLGIPVALLAARTPRDGWLRGDRVLLAAVWIYPLFGNALETLCKLGIAPLIFLALILVAVRRTLAARRSERFHAPAGPALAP